MKKVTSILISVIVGLALINGLGQATEFTRSGLNYKEYELKNVLIPTSSAVTYNFGNVGGAAKIDFVVAASTGNIGTANYSFLLGDGTVISTGNIVSGTGITSGIMSGYVKIVLGNAIAAPARVTGNVIVRY